jgi:uncharacterized LabA/DUF88 family protein
MNYCIYVDNSNLFIEGQRLSAVRQGYAVDIRDAMERRIFDFNWNIDYGKLHDFLSKQGILKSVKLWGSIPPTDSFWKMVESKGFQVRTFERGVSGQEKKVDVAIAHQLTKDVYSGVINKSEDTIVLVAGDKDFVPVIEDLVSEGYNVHIVFWNHAARELKDSASYFINLNPQIEVIRNGGPKIQSI